MCGSGRCTNVVIRMLNMVKKGFSIGFGGVAIPMCSRCGCYRCLELCIFQAAPASCHRPSGINLFNENVRYRQFYMVFLFQLLN